MTIQANFPNVLPSLLLDFANGKKLDPRVTFTRATTATYYDDNTTAMAEQNILLYSQEFNNAVWNKTFGTMTANQDVAPDGTTTADLFTPSDIASRFDQAYTPSSTSQHTFSIWLRSATGSSFSTELSSWRSSPFATTGTTTITVTTTWQRFTLAVTPLDLTTHFVVVGGANTLSVGENLYVWGAQLEQRSAATAYTPTTTQPITNYIPVLMTAGGGQPRFDHNPTTRESLGLLIEEQRTNLVTYSAQFDNGSWGKDGGISVTANQAVAPDGTIAMDLMTRIPGSLSSWAQLTNAVSVGTGGNVGKTYSFSVWVQALPTAGSVNGSLAISDVSYNTYTSSFIATTTPTRVSITTSGGSGWNANGAYIGGGINLDSNNTSVLVWGAQLEVGAFPTSYIPTVAAAATRAADVAQMIGTNFNSWFNNAQGTFVATVSAGTVSNTGARVLKISDTDSNRLIDFYINGSTSEQAIYSYQNGIVSANYSAGTISTSKYLTAVSYATGNISALINGGSVTTSTSAVVSSVANSTFSIGYDPISGANQISRPIAKIAYYPIQVTSANLQALTS